MSWCQVTEVGADERAVGDAVFALNGLRLACQESGERGVRAAGFVACHGINAVASLLAVRAEDKVEDEEEEEEEEDSDEEDEEETVEKVWDEALDLWVLLLSKHPKACRLVVGSSVEALAGLLSERDYDRPLVRKMLPVLRALCGPGSKVREVVVEGGPLEVLKKLGSRLAGDERSAGLVSDINDTIAAMEAK